MLLSFSGQPVLSYKVIWLLASSTGIFVAIASNILDGSKKRSCSVKIFCKFPTVNISKLIFLLCIAKNVLWTTLKTIFLICWFFLHPQIADFQIVETQKILSYPNKPYINGKLIYLPCMWCIIPKKQNYPYDWFCGPESHFCKSLLKK